MKSTRQTPEGRSNQPFSLYRELHPEMFREDNKPPKPKFTRRARGGMQRDGSSFLTNMAELFQSGLTGTAMEISTITGYSPASVRRALAGGKLNIKVVGYKEVKSNRVAIWGKA